jgi:hypothetical protein
MYVYYAYVVSDNVTTKLEIKEIEYYKYRGEENITHCGDIEDSNKMLHIFSMFILLIIVLCWAVTIHERELWKYDPNKKDSC